MMKEIAPTIIKAAKDYLAELNKKKQKPMTMIDFCAGALSDAARDYWYKQYEKDRQKIIDAAINKEKEGENYGNYKD